MSKKSGHSMKSKKAAKIMDTEQPEALDIPGLDSEDPEKRILILKREKIKIKTSFTKLRNKLLKLLDDEQDDYELPSRTMVREYMECMVKAQETALMVMDRLSQEYNLKGDDNALKGITQEMELIDNELVGANRKAEEYLQSREGEPSSVTSAVSEKLAGIQKKQVLARKEADKIRAVVNQKEQDFILMKKKIEEEHRAQIQQMEKLMLNEQGKLQKAEEELAKCQLELEKTIYEELGIQPHKNIKFESSEDKYEPDQVVQHQEEPQNEEPHQSSTGTNLLGRDMWRQLEKVTIPIFSGNKAEYEGWKAAFTSCVDNAPATPQYKLLQMKKYLGGEALISVKKLGHSASAYATAKERLERKYGGKRRRIALIKEELDQIKPLRDNQAKDMEMFADALDVCVANLIDVDKSDELGNGTFYSTMLVKLTDAMLTDYQRWLDDKNKEPNVQSLREWVIREADFLTVTQETKRGVSEPSSRTMYAKRQDDDNKPDGRFNKVIDCPICNNEHFIWYCDTFKSMDIEDRWNAVTKHRLCFSCLGKYHTSRSCRKNMKCGINGCQDSHNRLLHKEEVADSANTSRVEQEEVSQRSHTTVTHCSLSNAMALRTVPVILKHGAKRLKVNALLDDGSTQTYVNADVAAQLGLHGTMQRVQIGVLNGKVESLETMSVRMGLESLDGSVDVEIDAYTTDRVTGDLRVVDWKTQASCWKHLWGIPFPSVGKRPIIDILIGIDYADLHFSFQDVRGGQGEPIARKTPLGWTCVSAPGNNVVCTNFARTYFIKAANPENDVLDAYLKKFWELEEIPRLDKTLNSQEQKIMQEATDSLSFVDEHYQVRIPWRTETNELPNNYDQALNRLQSTEKKLLKSPDVATAYNDVIESYIEKGYISKVDVEAEEENNKHWYLPHFAVVKPEKETTKVRIVFDAATKYKGISLNDIIHQGPKLQQDLQSVLNRFRMNPIALVCDIAEMYLRIEIAPTDRPYHRFLWRNLETDRSPDVYQFNRVVFDVNCSPFLAQFMTQHHARVNRSTFPMASSTVLKSTHIGDSMDSVNSEKEALINSRPLTYQSASPQDNTPLTPNHFLHGQVGGQFAPETVDTKDFSLRKRWRRVQEITRHFWRRRMQEWLPSLNARKKWFFPEREVQEGDIVLVVSQETVRGHWPLARITEVFPGKDGHVRVVKLMCAGTEMKRSITKICPLELNANTQD